MMKLMLVLTVLLGTNLAQAEDPIARCTGKLSFGDDKIQVMNGTLMLFAQGDLDPIDTIRIKLQLKTTYDEITTGKGTVTRNEEGKNAALSVDMPYIGKITGTLTPYDGYYVLKAKDPENYSINGILTCRYK